MFQSALPHGERRGESGTAVCHLRFQSALPHGERPPTVTSPLVFACFNPRSRMGSDVFADRYNLHNIVSIRAPAWGATTDDGSVQNGFVGFNPRSRMGSDDRPAP